MLIISLSIYLWIINCQEAAILEDPVHIVLFKLQLPCSSLGLVIIEHCHFENYLEVRNSFIYIMSIEYLEQLASRFIYVSMNIGVTI